MYTSSYMVIFFYDDIKYKFLVFKLRGSSMPLCKIIFF